MEILDQKYENFKNAFEALGRIIELTEKLKNDISEEYMHTEDLFSSAIIKHFEITYETCWKFLKQYVQKYKNIDLASPKSIFRACYDHSILPLKITEELSQLSDARNKTTHIYNQILAQEVSSDIVKHQQVFGEILKILKPKINN